MSDDYEFTMLTSEQCPHCAAAKKGLKEKIESGRIKVVDVYKDKGAMDLANKHNVTGVPSIVIKDKATQLTEACELKRDLSGIICKNKEVKF